jgi:hypothetical protein
MAKLARLMAASNDRHDWTDRYKALWKEPIMKRTHHGTEADIGVGVGFGVGIGVGEWTYEYWRGQLYPAGLAPRRVLGRGVHCRNVKRVRHVDRAQQPQKQSKRRSPR